MSYLLSKTSESSGIFSTKAEQALLGLRNEPELYDIVQSYRTLYLGRIHN